MSQVTVIGGPTAGVHIKYHTIDSRIISVQETTGRLSAISPGKTVNDQSFMDICLVKVHADNASREYTGCYMQIMQTLKCGVHATFRHEDSLLGSVMADFGI